MSMKINPDEFKNLDPALPWCIDLDGTLIFDDVLWVSMRRLAWRNPLQVINIIRWWRRGRAHLKQQLAQRIAISPADLNYNHEFLEFITRAKAAGFSLYLVTAADAQYAQSIADYLGVFVDVMASNGTINLRADAKAKALVQRFGSQGFIYAGNSVDDLRVWQDARHAIVVNPDFKVRLRVPELQPIAIFHA